MYNSIIENIDNPFSQFGLRSFIELAFNTITYNINPEAAQTLIAKKFWLLNTAFIISSAPDRSKLKEEIKIYDAHRNDLKNKTEENFFRNLKRDNFPQDKIIKKMERLNRKIMDKTNQESIIEELKSLDIKYTQYDLKMLFNYFSQFIHANPVILTNLESEKSSKSHKERLLLIVIDSALIALQYIQKKIIDKDSSELQKALEEYNDFKQSCARQIKNRLTRIM